MKVAAIQMVSSTRLADNLDRAGELIAEAARGGAELAVLPEYFCLLGQRDTDKLAIREPFGCAVRSSGFCRGWHAIMACGSSAAPCR
jgi:predicted amidohydrolase